MGKVGFRIITDHDRPFLEGLYADSRAWEFQNVIMSDEQKVLLLKQQFFAQDKAYKSAFLTATHRIITYMDNDIGRLIINRRDDALHIIDFAILTEFQGRGIGGDILKALKHEAQNGRVPVELSVVQTNPAMNLYLREGFVQKAVEGHHIKMQWSPNLTPREI